MFNNTWRSILAKGFVLGVVLGATARFVYELIPRVTLVGLAWTVGVFAAMSLYTALIWYLAWVITDKPRTDDE